MKWLSYFNDTMKQKVLDTDSEPSVDYGEVVYRSSEFLDNRWFVAKYLNEYNVFIEHHETYKYDRKLAATFLSKERAIAFAAEMFLICCGRVTRKNRRCLSHLPVTE